MDGDRLLADSRDLATGMETAELGDTVRRLKVVLVPVEPSPAFREHLRRRLELATHRDPYGVQIAASGERTREVLMGAALVSLAGALVYLWRSRYQRPGARAATLPEHGPLAGEVAFRQA